MVINAKPVCFLIFIIIQSKHLNFLQATASCWWKVLSKFQCTNTPYKSKRKRARTVIPDLDKTYQRVVTNKYLVIFPGIDRELFVSLIKRFLQAAQRKFPFTWSKASIFALSCLFSFLFCFNREGLTFDEFHFWWISNEQYWPRPFVCCQ